jgi:hypothetical protein
MSIAGAQGVSRGDHTTITTRRGTGKDHSRTADLIKRNSSAHRHGTRVAYVADNCRCTPCRVANRAAERQRMAALRSGQWHPLVDATAARTHLKLLRDHGVGLDQIVEISHTP